MNDKRRETCTSFLFSFRLDCSPVYLICTASKSRKQSTCPNESQVFPYDRTRIRWLQVLQLTLSRSSIQRLCNERSLQREWEDVLCSTFEKGWERRGRLRHQPDRQVEKLINPLTALTRRQSWTRRELFNVRRQLPPLTKLPAVLKADISYPGSKSHLRTTLAMIGFT